MSRVGGGAILALWCLLTLVSGATQALCLDLGGGCSTPAAAAAASCHGESPESDLDPGCGSCVDVLVPDEASARSDRPGHGLAAPAASPLPFAAETGALLAGERAVPATLAAFGGMTPLHPALRSTVLLI